MNKLLIKWLLLSVVMVATHTVEAQQTSGSSGGITVTGTVIDAETDEPLAGAAVTLQKDKTKGVVTDADGKFSIRVPALPVSVVVTYMGFKPQTVNITSAAKPVTVLLEEDTQTLQEVVVEAGIIQHNKLGFTGSYKTVNAQELKAVGNINVLKTLSSLDPSFVIAENTLMGSDPNTLSNISLRGGSTMNITNVLNDQTTNPNEPLFILDGFETTLQVINDLDINRIESITLLKDAGSTAIYGSKGGNGVVVVETIKPKVGEVQISYNGNFQVAAADLSDYNMMNAAEKLEFEVKSGRYGNLNDWSGNSYGIQQYYAHLEQVQRGVDTYWLKIPIRTALTQSHSVTVSGGNDNFLYQAGVNYKDVEGVMKASDRLSYGGNMRLTYRTKKINISNNLTVSFTDGHTGSWGSFSNFVNANPYYTSRNEDGTIPMDLDYYYNTLYMSSSSSYNPLYNAMLASRNDTKNMSLTNNLSFSWFITEKLRWQASASLSKSSTDGVNFKDPKHTDYIGTDYTLKGSYSSSFANTWRYDLNTSLSYALTLANAHNLTFQGRVGVQSQESSSEGYVVTGFPPGVDGIPSYAYGYREGSRPSYSKTINRTAKFVTAFNYNYKYRYLLDLSYNSDGTTSFGRNRKFKSFYSAGLGWNLHKEEFAKDWQLLNELKLHGTYGTNANMNVGDNVSTNVYSYYSGSDIFGTASYLSGYANPDLEWQVVKKYSAGIDASFLKSRMAVTLDVYQTKTDPMVISMEQKLSSGVSSYPVNMGYVHTRGLEFAVSYYILRNIEKQTSLNVRVTGNTYRSEYGGFGEALENLNNAFKSDASVNANLNPNSLIKYQDGNSPTALWAVRSLGIDPSTGREIFLTKEGIPTSTFNIDDRVKIADSNPDIRGVIGFNFRYGRLTANLNLAYSLGGYKFNSALFNKVENISYSQIVYNQDRRALYDRWQEPGDIAQFKGISENLYTASSTQMSSRFIQRDNYLKAESGRLAWDINSGAWLKTVGLRDLQVSVSMADLFRITTIREERGTDYPFERSVSLGLSANFAGVGAHVAESTLAGISDRAMNQEINRLRETLSQRESDLEACRKAAAEVKPQQAAAAAAAKEVVKEVEKVVYAGNQTGVFFNINSSKLDDRGLANIKLFAKSLKENPDRKYKVVGYADAATGNAKINQQLSDARAKAVYDALIAEGVKASQLTYVGLGDTQKVFEKNDLNRAVIIENF